MDQPVPATKLLPSATRPKRNRWRNPLGWVLTAIYLGLAAWYALANDVAGMEADKLAEFVGGVFAPLAFLWLVLGFFQQGDELRLSADALWLQGEELRNSVEQQRQLVEATRESIAFERERLEQDREDLKHRSQPDFHLEVNGWTQGIAGRAVTFIIINRGAECTDLRIEILDTVLREPRYPRGETRGLNVIVPRDYPEGDVTGFARYFDLLGSENMQAIKLTAYKDHEGYTVLDLA